MKYTIVINQKKALELGLSFDEAVLITCVHDLLPLASFQKNENSEVWITHTKFLSEYPMLKIGRTTLYNRLKKLVDKNLLTKAEKIAQAKKMNFYGLTPKSELLFTDSHVHNLDFTCSESELVHVHNLDFTCSESEHNKYTNYPNTNYKDTNDKQKEVFNFATLGFSEKVKSKIKEHEQDRRKKHTSRTLAILVDKTEEEQLAILQRSIDAGWIGLFVEKNNSFKNRTPKPHQEMADFDNMETKKQTPEEFANFVLNYMDDLTDEEKQAMITEYQSNYEGEQQNESH